MLSVQPKSQRTSATGIAEVTIWTAPAAGKTAMVVTVRYTNLDSVDHTPILKKTISASVKEIKRVAGVPAGACEEEWCSVNRPIHLQAGESLVGDQAEATTATEPEWLVEGYEGTD